MSLDEEVLLSLRKDHHGKDHFKVTCCSLARPPLAVLEAHRAGFIFLVVCTFPSILWQRDKISMFCWDLAAEALDVLWKSMRDESWGMQELQRALCQCLRLKPFLKDQTASKPICQSNLQSSSWNYLDAKKILLWQQKQICNCLGTRDFHQDISNLLKRI